MDLARSLPARRLTAVTPLLLLAIVLGACGSSTNAERPTAPPVAAITPRTTTPPGTLPHAPPAPVLAAPRATPAPRGPFPNGLLIADEGNGRLLVVDSAKHVRWRFPVAGSLPRGQRFTADDAFISPDGKSIVANDEFHQVIDRIDIATRKVVWQYGRYNVAGSGPRSLHNPDDAYPLANGDIVVADIVNCRILEIARSKRIVRTFGRTSVCANHAPSTYNEPNGDTPLPDGGLLITVIRGSRVIRLSPAGRVVFDIHVPTRYPSDAQLDSNGNIVVADYSSLGQVVCVTPTGRLVWRYAPTSGRGRLDHPSLATPLADGTVAVNDDFRNRMVVIDPRTMRIVWQYGRTDVGGPGPGLLRQPDGHQPVPANVVF